MKRINHFNYVKEYFMLLGNFPENIGGKNPLPSNTHALSRPAAHKIKKQLSRVAFT
jgi:hypothetical protein